MPFGLRSVSRDRSSVPVSHDAVPADGHQPPKQPSTRSRSFSFMGRSKSAERIRPGDSTNPSSDLTSPTSAEPTSTPRRSISGKNRLVKKQVVRNVDEILKQAREDIPAVPPVIPSLASPPELQTFGGDNAAQTKKRAGAMAMNARGRGASNHKYSLDMSPSPYGVPMPPMPASSPGNENIDPYARTESMTNRSRHSYASSFVSQVQGPRRVRRRKDPTPFNVLVIGSTNAGKTSFIEFLRQSCDLPAKKQRPVTRGDSMLEHGPPLQTSTSDAFEHHFLETELADGERIGLTLWDSEGLEKDIIDLQLRDLTRFIEGKFEETFSEENKVIRSPGKILDTHIHCVFLLLDPRQLDMNFAAAKKAMKRNTGATNGKPGVKPNIPLLENSILDERVELQVLRALRGKTVVVPVISKADTVTGSHMRTLKRAIWNIIKENDLDPLEALGIEFDEEEGSEADFVDLSSRQTSVDGLLGVPGSRKASKSSSTARAEQSVYDSNSVSSTEGESTVNGTAAARAKLETGTDPLPPLPLSILTPDPPDIHHDETEKTAGHVGREFPWGFADPYNETHCDFVRLKEIVLSEWRADLREKSQQVWYENWRTARLRTDKPTNNGHAGTGLQVPTSSPRHQLSTPRSIPNMTIRERPLASQRITANPLLSHPVRDSRTLASNAKAQATYGAPLSPPPSFAPPQPPQAIREFSFAGRDRVGSFSSPVRNSSPATRPAAATPDVTALPAVAADEVGVAK